MVLLQNAGGRKRSESICSGIPNFITEAKKSLNQGLPAQPPLLRLQGSGSWDRDLSLKRSHSAVLEAGQDHAQGSEPDKVPQCCPFRTMLRAHHSTEAPAWSQSCLWSWSSHVLGRCKLQSILCSALLPSEIRVEGEESQVCEDKSV